MKAIELIPVIHIIMDKYVKDEESKKALQELLGELIPEAVDEFLEKFGLPDPDLLIGL